MRQDLIIGHHVSDVDDDCDNMFPQKTGPGRWIVTVRTIQKRNKRYGVHMDVWWGIQVRRSDHNQRLTCLIIGRDARDQPLSPLSRGKRGKDVRSQG